MATSFPGRKTKYAGKYPHRIKSVSADNKGNCMLVANDGRMVAIRAEETGGKLPALNEDIRNYVLGPMTIGEDGTVFQNPLTRVRVKSSPQRPAGNEDAPSKRLMTRRRKTAKMPKGAYANPAASLDHVFPFYIVWRMDGKAKDKMLSTFSIKADAVEYAESYAYANKRATAVETVNAKK